ncbi:MAG: hypothetical protein JZU65_23910 [Chlorobium sp.]|nr:hypothetical protein [Chlorobium sp.]
MKESVKLFVQRLTLSTVGIVTVVVPALAHAEMTSLIDFAALKTDLLPMIGLAIVSAAAIGATVIGAKMCWKFFKSLSQG